jgi:hypothetical protein
MNNITNQNEYPLAQNSYAAFDAISLRNLIIQRLNDQGLFTDQNYIGSNLASIIDIVSFSFNTLIYYLNKTSTESTFTEAQLYENINRIVKLLDYKPVGYQTSTLPFRATANATFDKNSYTIPRYSSISVGGIPFSFNEDISFKIPTAGVVTPLNDLSNTKLLYQGVYRENPVYTASGDPGEVVTVNISNSLLDHFNLDVYVYEVRQGKWIQYKQIPNLYTEQSSTRGYEQRLNQNLAYEITFGNGINGRKLEAGDRVAIYVLQSSGSTGVVGPSAFDTNAVSTIYSTTTFNNIFIDVTSAEQYNAIDSATFQKITFNNDVGSTNPVDVESVDSIRNNAPANFKSQYRLVTQSDYETFVSTNFANFISNVRVFNNWDYMGKYMKYFQDISVSPTHFKQILLNQVQYSDACNFNNVYICATPKTSQGTSLKYLLPAQKELIVSNITPLKIMSAEVMFLDPIYKAVSFGVPSANGTRASEVGNCYLEVVKNSVTRRSDNSIIKEVQSIFNNFFDPVNLTLGAIFDYNSLLTEILSIDGVSKIRTKRRDTVNVYDGLSMFMWNPTFPNLDIQQITSTTVMRDFEIVYYNNISTIISNIQIALS